MVQPSPTNDLLDRGYLKQLRVEREQRQANENQMEPVRRASINLDHDVTINCLVSQRKAAKSITRMDEAIQSSNDALQLYRDWQNNFKNLCNRKLNKLAA